MKTLLDDVKAFHLATDTPVLSLPTFPTHERRELRMRLLDEEYDELENALITNNLPEFADAIADMIYILAGTALEFGIPLDKVWNEVQRSNMAKVDPTTGKVRKREDGKVLKPEGWTPPDIAKALFE